MKLKDGFSKFGTLVGEHKMVAAGLIVILAVTCAVQGAIILIG